MVQRVTLSRAARLVGVPRGVLQRQVGEGLLLAPDGMVATADIARLYPDADFESSGAFERSSGIKESAFGRRVLERMLPAREVLAQRLYAQAQELAEVRRHLQRYHDLVTRLADELDGLSASGNGSAVGEVRALLECGLAEVLGSESVDTIAVMDDMLKVVSAQVVVRPSGREFLVEGRETLLQAGLRAGLKLNYGCGNGTCGLCKARIVAGQVTRVAPSDYRFSESERQQGYTLLCAHSAASETLVLETLEAVGPADILPQEQVVKVKAIAPLAPDTLHLQLQTSRGSRLRFLAGQSVTLGLAEEGSDVAAAYPVASCPCDDRNLSFHVPRRDGDAFALRLFAGAIRVGEALNLRGPAGDFTLADAERPLAFVACDTGFAPIRSLIEHAIAVDAAEMLSLGWLATRPDGHYLANQCRAWAGAFDQFRYFPAQGGVEAAPALIAAMADARPLAAGDAYVAGPPAFVELAVAALQAHGVPAARIFAVAL
ncbi:MAG: 2Fe-2S iron-sulfur cluster binding domain-containing protein [Betaproteobacteria bacterium]|nr:2Fe-2S iron-sulfur cluster binding domain-containing protein [Betaproteobacteria bacterium]